MARYNARSKTNNCNSGKGHSRSRNNNSKRYNNDWPLPLPPLFWHTRASEPASLQASWPPTGLNGKNGEQWRTRRCLGGVPAPRSKSITMLKARGIRGFVAVRGVAGNMGNMKKHNGCLQFVNEHNANITSAPLFLASSSSGSSSRRPTHGTVKWGTGSDASQKGGRLGGSN